MPNPAICDNIHLVDAPSDRPPHAPRDNATVAPVSHALAEHSPASVVQGAEANRIGIRPALHAICRLNALRTTAPLSGNGATFGL